MGNWHQVTTLRAMHWAFVSFCFIALLLELSENALAQSSFAEGPWSGSVTCQLDIEQGNYSRHETQTWTLTGKELAPNGDMRIYEATWTATGQGAYLRPQGGQGVNMLSKWTVNVPPMATMLRFYMDHSQTVVHITQWGSQLRADYGRTGTHQIISNGVPQQSQDAVGPVYAWDFQIITEGTLSTSLSGSKSIQAPSLGADTQLITGQAGGPIATCNWQFTKATTQAKGKAPQKCSQVGASITQTFDALEADVIKQFESLVQQTTDPAQAASLKSQEQATINQLEGMKQQNLKAGSATCDGGAGQVNTANNSGASGTMNSGPGQPSNGGSQGMAGGSSQNAGGASPSDPNSGQTSNNGQAQAGPGSTSQAGAGGSGSSSSISQASGAPGSQSSSVPRLVNIDPPSVAQNTASVQVALKGDSTHWLMGTTNLNFGSGITTIAGPFFTSATDAYVVISVASDAAVGPRTVTVTSPYPGKTESVALPNGFNVTSPSGTVSGVAGSIPHPDKTAVFTNPPAPPLSGSKTPSGVAGIKAGQTSHQPPAPASGSYLVTLTRMRCIKAIRDDPFDRDGKGNEAYAAAWIRRFDRTGNFLEQSNAQTLVYGDTRNLPPQAREQAGSLSPTGGIGDGDTIPPNATAQRWGNASDSRFPLKLWEGTLTDGGDVLIFSPSIWESDDDQSVFASWGQTQNALGESLWSRPEVQSQINQHVFGSLVLGAVNGVSGNLSQVAASTVIGAFGVPLLSLPAQALIGGGKDRPIGLMPNPVDATALPNVTIVLTREIIETALARGSTAGILELDFQDTFKPNDWSNVGSGLDMNVSPGRYTMNLQVERVGGTSPSSANSASTPTEINAAMQKAADANTQMQRATNAIGQP